MARRGRCAPARSTAKSPTAFAANGAPRSTPISDPSSKPHGEDRSEPSTPSASPSSAAPCLAQLENVNGDLSNYLSGDFERVFAGHDEIRVDARGAPDVTVIDRFAEGMARAAARPPADPLAGAVDRLATREDDVARRRESGEQTR